MSAGTDRGKRWIADLLAPAVALLCPFANFVQFHDYPWTSTETLLIVAAIGLVGLVLGGIVVLIGTPARVVLISLAIIISLDFAFEFWSWRPLLFAMMAVGVVIGAVLVREHLSAIVASTFAVLFLANTVAPTGAVAWRTAIDREAEPTDTSLTPTIHLILDAHLGVDGLLPSEGDERGRRQDHVELFVENGFQLYGGAFSHYFHTSDTIPNLLNFSREPQANFYFDSFHPGASLRENEYFRRMARLGYRIRVYQTEYLDYCSGAMADLIEHCETTPSTSIKALESVDVPAAGKMRVILSQYLKLSLVYLRVSEWYRTAGRAALAAQGIELPRLDWERPFVFSLTAPSVIERLAHDIVAGVDGTLFFAHLGVPHDPYVFDENCILNQDVHGWFDNWTNGTREAQVERIGLYLGHEACTRKLLAGFLDELRSAGVLERVRIIAHGDHGGRISSRAPRAIVRAQLTPTDYLQNYSVLFAVKYPSGNGRYVSGPIALPHLFEAAYRGDEAGVAPGVEPASIFLRGEGDAMIEAPMVWR